MVKESEQEADEVLAGQVEQFLATMGRFRQVMGIGLKRLHQPQELSATQFILLGLIEIAEEQKTPCTISWLAGQLHLNPATVVRAVDSMEKRGMVMRRRAEEDRRQVFVEFTEQGREARQQLHRHFAQRLSTIFSNMSLTGREALLQGLDEFIAAGQRQEEGGVEPSS